MPSKTESNSATTVDNDNYCPSINQSSCDKSEDANESLEHKSTNSNGPAGSILSSGPTPPPSGTSSKAVPKKKPQIEQMFETFYQSPTGEFKPTFYNPFEVKHRRRTSRSQFKILEKAFMENCKPSAVVRKALAQDLNMSARSIQVWFQNRRAKLKTMMKSGKMTEQQMIDYLASQQQADDNNDNHHSHQDQHDSPSSFEDSAEDSECENITPPNSKNGSFSVDRRSFPIAAKQQQNAPMATASVPFVCTSEMMKLGNSYPNQARNRSYSLPEIQRSPQLPFKQLQEALFGNPQQHQPNHHHHQQHQHHHQHQQQQHVPESSYYNTPLNAFQHYFRASNAAMTHVNNNSQNPANYYAAASGTSGQINVPHLNFTPLQQIPSNNQNTFEYQVDPNRFRPRSSSFAVGQRSSNSSNSVFSPTGTNYEMLSVIKEDSPITEYMSLPEGTGSSYFNTNDHESSELTNQINSLDLDYFMSANGGYHHNGTGHHHHSHVYSNYSSYEGSSTSTSLTASGPQSPTTTNGNSSNDYINELAFLPQPTNEILLSTLIDDEHFLH